MMENSFAARSKIEMRQATSLLNSTGSVIFIIPLVRALPDRLYSETFIGIKPRFFALIPDLNLADFLPMIMDWPIAIEAATLWHARRA